MGKLANKAKISQEGVIKPNCDLDIKAEILLGMIIFLMCTLVLANHVNKKMKQILCWLVRVPQSGVLVSPVGLIAKNVSVQAAVDETIGKTKLSKSSLKSIVKCKFKNII